MVGPWGVRLQKQRCCVKAGVALDKSHPSQSMQMVVINGDGSKWNILEQIQNNTQSIIKAYASIRH